MRGILQLLTPPFDRSPEDPGYIKGYLPGVRENGAQYTHAALWAVLATALQARRESRVRTLSDDQPADPHRPRPQGSHTYKVEPYVVAADVYTATGQLGRGGWTWYTGSASWMYRVGLEAILGFTKRGDSLTLDPCVPREWPGYRIEYRHGGSVYDIEVRRPGAMERGQQRIMLDGRTLDGQAIPLLDDGLRHAVTIDPATPTGDGETSHSETPQAPGA